MRLYHVSKSYSAGQFALRDVSIEFARGEFVFLTGPSGAGKTTLMRLIFAAERPSEGQILVLGRNAPRLGPRAVAPLRRRIGVVFQDFKLLPRRTVEENVALALEVVGAPRREVRAKVFAVLKQLGLQHRRFHHPPSLSGGEQQRVAIARALVNEPDILLADEPTGNLDHELTLEIMDLIAGAATRGTTVVVATHDQAIVERYGKRCVRLEGGRIVEDRAGAGRRAVTRLAGARATLCRSALRGFAASPLHQRRRRRHDRGDARAGRRVRPAGREHGVGARPLRRRAARDRLPRRRRSTPTRSARWLRVGRGARGRRVASSLISREQALERFRRGVGRGAALLEGLSENPLPASLEISLAAAAALVRGPGARRRRASRELPGVADVASGRDWVEGYLRGVALVRGVGTGLGVILALASLLIIANTIRLAVLSRRDELEILSLVGASRSFVAAPFLIEGWLQGALGGALALAALYAIFRLVLPGLEFGLELVLGGVEPRFFELRECLALVLAGSGLGLFGAGVAVASESRA